MRFVTIEEVVEKNTGMYGMLFAITYPNGEYWDKLVEDAKTAHWLAYLLTLMGDDNE